jgi:hypothetical protein
MNYILILVLMSTYGGHYLGTASVEFPSEAACKASIQTIRAQADMKKDGISIRGAYCVPKGV